MKLLIKLQKFQKVHHRIIQVKVKSETEIPIKRHTSPEKRQKIIDNLILT